MNQHLYRGKRLHEKEQWVYGDLVKVSPKSSIVQSFIIPHDNGLPNGIDSIYEIGCEVDPETVGRYTGRKAKGEVLVYEGDVIRFKDGSEYKVYWDNKGARYLGVSDEGDMYGKYKTTLSINSGYKEEIWREAEVIGNIHDK